MPKKSATRDTHQAHSSGQPRAQKAGPKERSGNLGGRRQKSQGKKLAGANQTLTEGFKEIAGGNKSKSGCFPKFLMLLLPFMAIGAYLFLRS